MNAYGLLELSNQFLLWAFILLLIAIIPAGIAVKSKHRVSGRICIGLTYLSLSLLFLYVILRWTATGHAPVSNMYEFMTFFGIMLIASTLLLYQIYRQIVVVLFSIPVSLIIIGFGGVFTSEATPLIPALQSHWLTIHVITVAFSSAIFSIAFATGVIYLLRVLDVGERTKHTMSLEFVMYCLFLVIGFTISSMTFSAFTEEKHVDFCLP